MKTVDVVIIGGGPAGSTVGTLLKKYFPYLHVVLLESARFPRHHIGESMLAGSTPVLKELDVYDKIASFGFPEKLGATYVWGRNGEQWGFEFQEIDGQLKRQGVSLSRDYFKGWQVTRADYDHILLDHAAEYGVEVLEGARVTEVRVETNARRGVTFVQDGAEHEIRADLVVDCSGQKAVLGNLFRLKRWDARLNNVAIYGYWEGARWKFEYVGHPNITRILIATTERGWIWYIPVRRNTISVGFVTHADIARGFKLADAYFDELRQSPEVSDLLAPAKLVRLTPDQRTDLLTERDWSYTCERMTGDGWMLVGDAAGFVDPILSSGVLLAHQNGQKAAYTITSVFSGSNPAYHEKYWRFYETTYKQMLGAYREMASAWYANNFSRETWWWQAWRQIALANDEKNVLTDRDSFMRLASGYANRTESTSLFGSYTIAEAAHLAGHLFPQSDTKPVPARDFALRLSSSAQLTTGFVFHNGRIHHTTRVVNPETAQYLDLYPGEVAGLNRLRVGCMSSDFTSNAVGGEDPIVTLRSPSQLLTQLEQLQVLDVS